MLVKCCSNDVRNGFGEFREKLFEDIFGNIEDVFAFHSQSLLPELERCGENSQMIARTFIDLSKDMERIYSRYRSLKLR